MNEKTKKHIFNAINLIIGLFFASGLVFMNYMMIIFFAVLLCLTVILRNQLCGLVVFAEVLMIAVFMCRLSVYYNFEHAISLGLTFSIIIQVFTGVCALFMFLYNFFIIRKEW